MFASLLVANRGEIAVRIMATARALGVRTIAVFSDADVEAMHVRAADDAVRIGPAPARDSYLNIAAIIEAARASGAEAIHPGYGFLSENAAFAHAVADAGLIFVGPDPEVIDRMSDKVIARAAAVAAGLPVLPGTDGVVASIDAARKAADAIGFPIAVKACFGGGGRGMRVAESAEALEAALESAAREAGAAFGRAELFLERYLSRPRHVEVQIMADRHGAVVHVGDRDCTVQRRHQKLIEEAPAPDLPDALRAAIRTAAVALCRAERYVGAGTVEFLVDAAAGEFYFLEMNTRLQVEHGVTEMIARVDLVEAQLQVAAGEPLAFAQEDVALHGHAIEARLAAEDAWDAFRPSPGRIGVIRLPLAPWIRADMGVEAGDEVQPFYDSMIAKLLAWGPTREMARVRLAQALRALEVEGVPTTAPYLADVLDQPAFRAARHFTRSVEQDWAPDDARRPPPPLPIIEEDATMPAALTERLVALPRPVAVFGVRTAGPPVAMPSGRAARGGDSVVSASTTSGTVSAPMDGTVIALSVAVGDDVAAGDTLLVIEAMKMEVRIAAPSAGLVEAIDCTTGGAIRKGSMLVRIAPSA